MTETSQIKDAPPSGTSSEEEANRSNESMDYKVPDSITKDAPGSSTTVDTGKFSVLQQLLLLATDQADDGRCKETLESALRQLDSAVKVASALSQSANGIESAGSLPEAPSEPSNSAIETESAGAPQEALIAQSQTAIEIASVGTREKVLSAPCQTTIEIESVGTLPEAITAQSQNAISTCLELDSEMVDLGNKLSEVETPTSSVGKMRSKKRRSKSGSQKRRLSQKKSSAGSAVPSSVALAGSSEMQVTFPANGVGPIVEQHVADCWQSETPISKSSKPAVDVESMNAVAGDVAVPYQREISACSRDEVDFQTTGSAPETLMAQSQTVIEIESIRTLPNILSTTSHTPIEIESVSTLEENVSAPSQTRIEIEIKSVATLEEAKTAIEIESVGILEEAAPAPSQTEIEIESVGTFPDAITGQTQNAISTCLELDSEMVDLGNKLSEVETPTSSFGKMRSKKRRSKSGSQKRRLSQKQRSVGSAVPSSVALAASSEMQVTFTANGVVPIVEQHVADCWPFETPISKSSKPAVDVELMNAVPGDVAVPFRREISVCSRDEVDFQTAGTESETLMEPSQTVIEIESVGTLPNILSTTSHTAIQIESVATLEENVSAPSQTGIEIDSLGTFPDAITGQSQSAILTCLELDSEMVDLGNKLSEVETPTSSVGKMRSKKRRSKSGSQKRRLSQKQSSVGSAVPSSVALAASSEMQVTFTANGVGPIVEQHVADCWPSETPISKSSKPAVDVESMNAVAGDVAVPFQRDISACSRDEVDFQTAGTAPETLMEQSQTVIEIESVRTLPNILSTTSHTPIEIESVSTLEENVSAPSQTGIEIEIESVATLEEAKTAIEIESVGILEEAAPAPSQTEIEIESVGTFPDAITGQSQNAISTCLELDSEMVDLGNKLSEVETPTSSFEKMRSKKRRSKSGSQKRRLSQKKSSVRSVALAGSSEMQVTFPANGVGPIVEQHVADCWQSETPISKSSKPAVDVESMNAVAGDVAVPFQRDISACSRDEVDFQTAGTAPETLMEQSQTVIEIESVGTLPNILSTTSHTAIQIESVATLEENVSAPSQTGIEIDSLGTFPDAITGQSQSAILTCLELDSEMVDLGNKLSEVEIPTSSVGKMRSKKRCSKSGSQETRLSQKQSSVGSAVPSSVALAGSSEMQVTFSANGVGPIVEQHVADCWPSETPISKSSKPAVDVESMNAVAGDVAVPFQREISACSRDEVDFQTAGSAPETLMEQSQTVFEFESVRTLPNILSTTSHTPIEIESVATLDENVSAPSQTGIKIESVATLEEAKTTNEAESLGTLEEAVPARSQTEIEIESVGTFPDAITGQSQNAISTCLELDSEMVDLGNKLSEVETPTSSVGKMRSKKRRSKSGSQKRRLSQKQSSVRSAVPSSVVLAGSSEMQVTFAANGVGPIVEQHVADCWPSETPISKSSKPAVDVESMNAVAGDVAVPYQREISACSRDEVDFQTAGSAPETLMEQSQTVIEIESIRTLPNILSTTSHTPIEIESVATLEENVSARSQTGIEIESVATLEEAKTAIEAESVGILEEAAPAPSQTEIEIESVGTFPDAITGQSQSAILTCLELDSEMVDLGNKLSEVETPTSSVGKKRSKKRRSKSGSQKRRLSQKQSSVGSAVPSSVALAGSSEMQVTFSANGVGPIVEQHVADCWPSETPISKSSKPAVDVELMNAVPGDVAVPFWREISVCSRDEVDFQTAGTAPETLMEPSQTVIEIESVGTLPNILSTTSHTAIQIESVATLEENVSAPSQTGIEIDSLGTFPDAITGQSQSAILTCLELDSEMVDLGNKLSEVETPTSSVGKMRSKKRRSKSGSQKRRLSQKQSSVGSAVPSSVALAGSSEMQVTFSANGVGPIVEQHVADCWPSETPISKSSKPAVDVESMNAVAGDVAVPFQREISACSRDEVDFQTAGSAPETLMEQSQTVFEIESVRTLPNILSTTSHTPIEIESVATLDENVSAPSHTGIKIESVATLEEAKTAIEAESLGTLEEAVPAPSQTEIEIESVGTFPDAITGQSQNAISTCLELDSEMVDLGNKLSEVETPTSSVGKMRLKKRRSKSGSQKRRLSQKQSSVGSAVPSSVALAGSSEMQVTFTANGVGPIVEQHVADCWPSETSISKSSKPAVDVELMNAVQGDVAVPFRREISACSRDEVDFQTAGTAPDTLMEPSQTVIEIESIRTLPNILSTTSHTPIEIESVATLEENVSPRSQTGIEIESVATLEEAKTAIEAESLGTLEEAVPAPSQTEIEIESVGTFPDAITGQSQNAISTCLELDSEMVDLGNKLSEVETPTSSVGKMRSKKRRSKSGSQKRRLSQRQRSVGSAVPSSVALTGSSVMQATFAANGVGPIVEQHVADCWPSETPISKSSKPAVDVESMNAVAEDCAVPFQREISACSRDEVDFQTAGTAPETLVEPSQTVIEIESIRTLPNILSTTSHTPIEIESVATLEENVSAPSQTGIEIELVATLQEAKTAIEAESVGILEEAVPAPSQTVIEIESVGSFPDVITAQSQNAISTCLELDSEMVDLGNKLSEVETPTSSVGKMRSKKRRSKTGSQKRRLSQKESRAGSAVPSSVALAGSSEMQVTFAANGVGPIVEQHVADCWQSETPISKSSKPAVDVESMNAVAEDVAVPFQREISACSRDEVDFQTAGTAPEALMEPSQTVIEFESVHTLPNILSTTSHTPIEIESVATLEENVSVPSQTGIEIESVATLEEGTTAIEAESVGTLEEAVPAPSQTVIEIESVGTFPDAITGQSQNAISTCLELESEMVDLGNKLSEVETPTSSVGKVRSKKRCSKSGSQKRRLSQKESRVGSAVRSSVALAGSSEMQVTFAANGVGPTVEQPVADCWPSETPISKSSKPAVDVESMNAVAEDVAAPSAPSQNVISTCPELDTESVDLRTKVLEGETSVSGDTDVRSSRRVSHKSGPRKRRLSQKHSSAELDVPSLEASTRSSKSQGSCGLRECGTPGSSCSQETEKVDWDTNLLPDYSPVSRLRTIGPRRRSCYKENEAASASFPTNTSKRRRLSSSYGGEGTKEQPVNEPIPMTATVKTEFAEPTVGEMNVPPGGISDTMGYVCYYVRAAFEALFGATGNLQDQVAAISALPPNWGQPTGERMAQPQNNRACRRRVRRVWNGEAFVPEEARREENGPNTRRRRRRN